ncbi:STAS domain-containing protein [Sandaracinus amylolyticus]|uniref:RsbR, positive regulator of sigma-B n=1 Tax=Sandaracinus amylolyticus TaxID=927083 RepID=A0A0F6YJ84_9BACT|nr:STAS domain-containing protein [Sandaracinus amylolyticus]AKF05926.1 RsbR, positive regulator of sigma-B [Sandaracinus amylolyticus]
MNAATNPDQQRIAELEAELARARDLLSALIEHSPDGILVFDGQGTRQQNPAARAMLEDDRSKVADWKQESQFFRPDRVTPMPIEETGGMRAMKGEYVDSELLWFVDARGRGFMLAGQARPLAGGGAIVIFRDVTERMELEADLAARNEALATRELENRELIERLRVALDELSTPVLEVREDVLVLPVIGIVDTQRSAQMSERLLDEIVRTRAKHVIVDLTGVELMDTGTADRFAKLARAVELLGSRCILSGLQPAVAQMLVELGGDFGGLETQRNLRHALDAVGRSERPERRAARR